MGHCQNGPRKIHCEKPLTKVFTRLGEHDAEIEEAT
jgi:hypothetical protein